MSYYGAAQAEEVRLPIAPTTLNVSGDLVGVVGELLSEAFINYEHYLPNGHNATTSEILD